MPNSYASITSATISSKNWVRARFVVDEKNDDILCVKNEQLKKSKSSSGTVVSVLVPVRNIFYYLNINNKMFNKLGR